MKITLISHASILVEVAGVRILTDPWYSGEIYQRAWELCPSPPVLPDFAKLDALFISHAHPDHYHGDTIDRILEARGAELPVFIAKFFHPNIARDLRSRGFRNVVEMRPGHEFTALPGVRFYSQQFRMDDSLLVISGDGETLVNINDTPLRGSTLMDLARRYPRVDYCFAQFAIAQGYPYCYEGITPDFDRADLVKRYDSFAAVLKPRFMIPFASFVRFCNQDNTHMNQHKMRLGELLRVSKSRLTVLYPGDSIDRGQVSHDPAHRAHFERAEQSTRTINERDVISAERLDAQMEEFVRKLRKGVSAPLLRKLPRFAFICSDHDVGYLVTEGRMRRKRAAELRDEPIQYTAASEVLSEAVEHDWGWSDLSIGARFRARIARGWEGREIWFWVIPMLGGEGYLQLRSLWFLRFRALQVWWGRRLEILDYFRTLLTGRFMTNVVRKKTAQLT